jgi:NitT/TauT family transport system permease protein
VKRPLLALGIFALLLGAWEAGASLEVWRPDLLPPPSRVLGSLADGIDELLPAALVTMLRLGKGYLLGVLGGLPLGLLCARSRLANDTLGMVALGFQTLPSVCWVPLALLWFGLTETAMLFVVVMGTLWSILLATDHGVRSVPPIYVRAARTMGSRRLHTLVKVVLPAALPYVLSGMKQGWAFAWRSLMAAEIYVTMTRNIGLGHMLHYGRELGDMERVLGVMLVIIVIGLIVEKIGFAPVERALHRRWGTGLAGT